MHVSDINRLKYYTFHSLSSQKWISITLSNVMSAGMRTKLFRSMWREKKDVLVSLTLVLQLSGLKHGSAIMKRKRLLERGIQLQQWELVTPNMFCCLLYWLTAAFKTVLQVTICSKLQACTATVQCFSFFLISSFGYLFLSLCLAVDHIRKTGWALEVCIHSPV